MDMDVVIFALPGSVAEIEPTLSHYWPRSTKFIALRSYSPAPRGERVRVRDIWAARLSVAPHSGILRKFGPSSAAQGRASTGLPPLGERRRIRSLSRTIRCFLRGGCCGGGSCVGLGGFFHRGFALLAMREVLPHLRG